MKNNGTIIDAIHPQTRAKQAKQLSWKRKLALSFGLVFTISVTLIMVNTLLVLGADGLNLILRILWSAVIDTILLSITLGGYLLIMFTQFLNVMSAKLVGASASQSTLKPWLLALARGVLALIAWKVWEWAKTSQQPYWQPGAGWTQTGN